MLQSALGDFSPLAILRDRGGDSPHNAQHADAVAPPGVIRGILRIVWRPHLFRYATSVLVSVVICAAACASPERRNKNCQWPGDETRPLNLADRSDQRHLDDDAQLAEELATRYADYRHKIPYGYEGHGGLLEGGRVGTSCLAALDAIIQQKHGVTEAQITEARNHRPPMFDLSVLQSFAVMYGLLAVGICRALVRYGAVANTRARVFAVTALALAMSAAGVQLLDMWATTAEMIRIGNDHLSPRRGALIPWRHHYRELFVAGVVFFWTIALTEGRKRVAPASGEATLRQVLELR
jgi:hypothetical protein